MIIIYMALVPLALPFIAVEGASIIGTSGTIISSLGGFLTSVMAFTGAGVIINDVIKIVGGEGKNEIPKLPKVEQKDIVALSPYKNGMTEGGQKAVLNGKSALNRF